MVSVSNIIGVKRSCKEHVSLQKVVTLLLFNERDYGRSSLGNGDT
jgi:hypothetical protein